MEAPKEDSEQGRRSCRSFHKVSSLGHVGCILQNLTLTGHAHTIHKSKDGTRYGTNTTTKGSTLEKTTPLKRNGGLEDTTAAILIGGAGFLGLRVYLGGGTLDRPTSFFDFFDLLVSLALEPRVDAFLLFWMNKETKGKNRVSVATFNRSYNQKAAQILFNRPLRLVGSCGIFDHGM